MSNLADRKKKDAIQQFINREFDAIPQEMVLTYLKANDIYPCDINITEITKYDPVYCDDGKEGEVVAIKGMDDERTVDVRIFGEDEDKIVNYPINEVSRREPEGEYGLPMWGTMWLLEANYWSDHVQELSDSGFTVYELEDLGQLVVGIDGAGYDFYEAHWNKLYDKMGYTWHEGLDYEAQEVAKAAVEMAAELGIKPKQIAEKLNIDMDYVKAYMPKENQR